MACPVGDFLILAWSEEAHHPTTLLKEQGIEIMEDEEWDDPRSEEPMHQGGECRLDVVRCLEGRLCKLEDWQAALQTFHPTIRQTFHLTIHQTFLRTVLQTFHHLLQGLQ